jgi:hypothetical protein
MAEIKSTLELIMEKTKDLTLTDEEKKAFRAKEIKGKVKGFIMKYMDDMMDLETLKQRIVSLEKEDPAAVEEVVVSECLSRINLEAENSKIFDILRHVTAIDVTHLHTFLADFLKKLDHERTVREQDLSNRINEKGFSGSAVFPNLKSDPEWTYFVEELKTRFRKDLQNLVLQ